MSNKSFTLIELLVVIVIIGILAGVIIVSVSSSINKANFAKAQSFSNTVQNELLGDLVSEWTFDIASNPGEDTWGNNNGTVSGATYEPKEDGVCVYGGCYSFDGVDDYIYYENGNNLNIADTITVSLWVKSTKNNASLFQGIVGKANLSGSEYGWIISKMVDNKFYFQVKNNNCSATRNDVSTYSNQTYTDNAWHHIVGVLESNGSHFIYINGVKQSAFSSATSWTPAASSIKLVTGTAYGDLPVNTTYLERFRGLIDDVRIYNEVLSSSQIKKQYVAGLDSLLSKGSILKEEYNQKLNALAYAE